MISVYRQGRIWWARGSVNGLRIKRRSLDTQFRDVALRRAADLELKLGSGEKEPKPWREFESEFLAWITPSVKPKTLRKYEFVLSRFSPFLRENSIAELTSVVPSLFPRYTAWRSQDAHPTRRTTVGSQGMKADLRVLKRVFSYAIQCGYIASNPVKEKNLNSQPRGTLPFSREEVRRMLGACVERDPRGAPVDLRPVILFFLSTGLRISDVIHCRRDSVQDGCVVVGTRKRGKVVRVPLTEECLAAISDLPPRGGCLFSTASGKPIMNLDASLRRLWKRAGIEHAHAHRFRDTFAVRMLEAGATLYDVSKLLGIAVTVAERHYAPYVKELQDRAKSIIASAKFF